MKGSRDKYDVIIIGAGPNGMTAGGYLAKAGAQVLILEKTHEAGGGLWTDEFAGFRFNLHATFLFMMEWMPPYKDLELEEYGCKYIKPEAAVSLLTRDGKALTLYADIEKSAQSIAKFSQKDAVRYREVMREWYALTEEALIPATYTMPMPMLDMVVMYMNSEIGRKVNDLAEENFVEILNKCGFENEYLKTALMYLGTMWGLDPEIGLGFLFPLFVNRMLNTSIIVGGSHSFASALYKVCNTYGADILEAAEVIKIICSDGKAVGVELDNGDKYYGRAVITTTDPQTTFLKMVGEDICAKASRGLVPQVKSWEWESVSLFNVNYALNEPPRYKAAEFDPDVNKSLIKIMGVETVADLLRHIKAVQGGKFEVMGSACTLTDLDPIQAPWDVHPGSAVARWESLAPYENQEGDWEKVKDKYADEIFKFWTHYAPNLAKAKVIRRYPYHPRYIEEKLASMKKGSIKHGAYVPTQMLSNRPNIYCSSYKTPIPNLYVAGASTWPGGMVLLGGGYNAAGVVARDLSLKKWWEEPDFIKEARKKGLVK